MTKQNGFIDLDGLISSLIVLGVLAGVILGLAIPALWSLLKPWIHAVTG